MKTLFMLRHSKAGQGNKKILDDHERPLTEKGEKLCKPIAAFLQTTSFPPELFISSTAVRARKTGELVQKHLLLDVQMQYLPKLYLASAEDIFKEVANLDNTLGSVLFIGHNPGLQNFCLTLAEGGKNNHVKQMKNSFAPGSLAVFRLPIESWSEVDRKIGRPVQFFSPQQTQ